MSAQITTDQVWSELEGQLFAVLGFVTPKGEPRSAGINYVVRDHKLYISTDRASWKAKYIAQNPHVSITVPIAKRVPFMPWIKIPAATITFSGSASVLGLDQVAPDIVAILFRGMDVDDELVKTCIVIEVVPERDFVTYGVGVPLMAMRRPEDARGRAPVAA